MRAINHYHRRHCVIGDKLKGKIYPHRLETDEPIATNFSTVELAGFRASIGLFISATVLY